MNHCHLFNSLYTSIASETMYEEAEDAYVQQQTGESQGSSSVAGLRERIVSSRGFGNFLEDRLLTRYVHISLWILFLLLLFADDCDPFQASRTSRPKRRSPRRERLLSYPKCHSADGKACI